MEPKPVTAHVPQGSWDDVRGDRTFLKSTLWLGGCPMHLEAVEVREQARDRFMTAVDEEDEERLQSLEAVYAARWETLKIGWPGESARRTYVVWAVPFGR